VKVKKGEKLVIVDSRKGTYHAVATSNFDTEKDNWYDVAVDQDEPIYGIGSGNVWRKGDGIPCRNGQAQVKRRQ
jgi:hypothetical protein